MKKKVVIITNGTLPVPAILGGAAENLIEVLLEYNEVFKDFNFVVFTVDKSELNFNDNLKFKNTEFVLIKDSRFFYKIEKVFRYIVNKKFNNFFPNQFLSRVLKNKKQLQSADLILVSNNLYYGKYLRQIVNCPIYLHLHNDYINEEHDTVKIELLNYFNKVIGVSEFIKKRVLKVAPKSCKVSYVYNGIDLNRVIESSEEFEGNLKVKYNLNKDDIVFIFSGRIQKSKGVVFLLESFLVLLKKHKNIKLLFVGGSVYHNSKINKVTTYLKNLVAESLACENVFFTGYIDHKDIHHFYKVSTVAILPSIETEAFGLTSIEAQAAGLPVIISDAGGMPETINKDCGFIVKTNEDMKSQLIHFMNILIKDQKLRENMSKQAFLNSQRFSNSFYYERIKSELNEL